MTPQTLINSALLALGEIQPGESPSSTESDNALLELNRIYDSWSLEGITCYNHAVSSFGLTGGQGAYTMGIGGSWNIAARPVKIKGALVTYQGLQQGLIVQPLGAFEQSVVYDSQVVKPIEYLNGAPVSAVLAAWATGNMPRRLGEDSNAPLKNVRVWPIPIASASIEVSYWMPLTVFATLATTILFPVPGYEAALVTELAMVLAPAYGRPVPAELSANMQRFKSRINEINGQIEVGPLTPAQGQ